MGSALVVAVVKYGLLVLLWCFVLLAVRTIRNDLGGRPRPAAAPRPEKVRGEKARAEPRPEKVRAVKEPRGARSSARRLVVTEGSLAGTTVTLGTAPVTLGRADDSTLVLTDDYASTRHARLVPGEAAWRLEDLGSTNGTYLAGTKVSGLTPVPLGAQIRIGKTVLELAHVTLVLRFAARSHAGLLRPGNEDSVYAGPRLLAVADGMGGHAAGEVASAVAIGALAPLDEDAPGTDLLAALREAAMAANTQLQDLVDGDPALEGMGTTLTAVLSAGNRLGLLHIGDSRAYLLRDGVLAQITHDHTLVQTLVDEGRITEEEATTHPHRSMITRTLNGWSGVEFDLSVREVRAGDRYLLCSDGLTGPVGSLQTLQEALSITDPQEAVDRLVQLALRGGGPDNVTVVVADAVDGQERSGSPVVAGAAAETPQAPPAGLGDSAAGRARVAEGRDVPDSAGADDLTAAVPLPVRTSSRRRSLLVAALAAVVLVAGAGAAWAYVRSQYYVGLDGDRVAVFQGVRGSVAGVSLSTLLEHTQVASTDLPEVERDRLEEGITATGQGDARAIVARLLAAACPVPSVSAPPVPTALPTPALTDGATPAPVKTPVSTLSRGPAPVLPLPSALPTAVPTAVPSAVPTACTP